MKLSELKKVLMLQSKFTSKGGLAVYTGVNAPFTSRFIDSTKGGAENEDILFDALTEGISVGEALAAIELIRQVKLSIIKKEQFL